MSLPKTSFCQLVAYCETSGGPVGICSLSEAKKWLGSEQPNSLYWAVVEAIGMTTLFMHSNDYQFFNTEVGNFAFFRGPDTLVLVEVISIEDAAAIPWRGIEFDIIPDTRLPVNLDGFICFFDAALSPHPLASQEVIHAVDQYGVWNAATLLCNYQEAHKVKFLSGEMRLAGVCFLRNG